METHSVQSCRQYIHSQDVTQLVNLELRRRVFMLIQWPIYLTLALLFRIQMWRNASKVQSCILYKFWKRCYFKTLDEMRYNMYHSSKSVSLEDLPPTSHSSRGHIPRALHAIYTMISSAFSWLCVTLCKRSYHIFTSINVYVRHHIHD